IFTKPRSRVEAGITVSPDAGKGTAMPRSHTIRTGTISKRSCSRRTTSDLLAGERRVHDEAVVVRRVVGGELASARDQVQVALRGRREKIGRRYLRERVCLDRCYDEAERPAVALYVQAVADGNVM